MKPTRDDLIDLRFTQGMTREGIAEYFDVNVATVRRWIREMKIPRPRKRSARNRPAHLSPSGEIVGQPMEGRTVLEIARMKLAGRLIERPGYGYYLDGYPASVDKVLAAASQCD